MDMKHKNKTTCHVLSIRLSTQLQLIHNVAVTIHESLQKGERFMPKQNKIEQNVCITPLTFV